MLFVIVTMVRIVHLLEDRTALFNKDSKMDKLVISNQIGYHFRRVVREVSQELFIARKVDVSALFLGISMLKQTQIELERYCTTVTYAKPVSSHPVAPPNGFILISKTDKFTFAEAKSKCKAQGMQLPELYTDAQRRNFTNFLRVNGIPRVFAGIQPDLIDTVHRFVATGFPLWQTPHSEIFMVDGKTMDMKFILDDMGAKFFYTNDDKLLIQWDSPTIFDPKFTFGDHHYMQKIDNISQFHAFVVCQAPWDGLTIPHFSPRDAPKDLRLNFKTKRSIRRNRDDPNFVDVKGLLSLTQYCYSIANQAEEIGAEMFNKTRDLLELVDITMQADNLAERQKRSPFLAKFMFFNGARMIWNLFGILQRMRMNARIGRLEDSLAETQAQVGNNSQAISNMSLTIYGHSIAIQHLKVTTADLERRLSMVESRVGTLETKLSEVMSKVEAITSLSLISSLITRVQQSLNSGYDILKDIVHSSLLGQTSPLLLPYDQIKLVQSKVQEVSIAILDTNFAKMQSVVVADPQDPHLLLVVINAAALSRRNVELIKMVPIPYYEGSKTYTPILDYDTVLLDHLSRSYSILSEQEEYDCLTNRCYVSDIEHSVNEKTCGIPQWFNQHLDTCVLQETLVDGVFLKPMLPDGVLFAFRDEVTTQLFCKDNSPVGPPKRLAGTGTIQLPNGCLLSVTDKLGRNTKVKGQPLYRMINAGDLDLAINGPLNGQQAIKSLNESHRLLIHGTSVSDHLSSVVRQVETVDIQLQDQKLYIWILVGIVIAIIVITLISITIAYQHRGKFYFKIHELRDRFIEVRQALIEVDKGRQRGLAPRAPLENPFKQSLKGEYNGEIESSAYIAMSDFPARKLDITRELPFHSNRLNNKGESKLGLYPPLSPLIDQLSDINEKLEKDLKPKPYRPGGHLVV